MIVNCILFYFEHLYCSAKEVEGSIADNILKLSNLADLYPNYIKTSEIKSFLSNISEKVDVNEVKTQLLQYIEDFETFISQLELKRDELDNLQYKYILNIKYYSNDLKDKSLLLEDNAIAIDIINEIDIFIHDNIQLHTIEDYDNYINKLQQIYDEIEYY